MAPLPSRLSAIRRLFRGQSPLAPDRPYTRFVASHAGEKVAQKEQNIAINHPVSASSETTDHGAKFANDGDMTTGWQAADNHPGAWWQIDMEGLNTISSVETTFGDAANYQYKIEASNDGNTWTLLADQTQTTSAAKVRNDACAKNDHNRYLHLTITGLPANQAALVEEVKIFARPSP
jgi:hypothetical protein